MKINVLKPLVLLATTGFMQISVFGQTYLNDDFNGTAINTNVWTTIVPFCDSEMYESNGVAVFVNNGSLLTKMALPTQYEVDGQFQLAGSPYDFFTLVLRTDSTLTSCEQFQGISFTACYTHDWETPGFQNVEISDNIAGITLATNFPFAMDTFYSFKILDNGTNVTIYFGNTNTPFLTLNTTNRNGFQLGIQNRDGACGNSTCQPSTISAGSVVELNYLTVSALPAVPALPAAPFLTNGLVAFYPFNGNPNDTSGNGNNGTPYNISYVADRFGNPNAAASFAGNSTSYIDVLTTNLDLTPPFSVSVWISYGTGTGGPRIFSTSGYEMTLGSSGQSQTTPININGMGITLGSTNTIEMGVWSHVVGVWTTNSFSIYINGVLSASLAPTSSIDFSRWPYARIGGNSGKTSDDNYGGLIDDLAIYDRVLSPLEVAEIYQSSLIAGITLIPGILVTGNTNQTYSIQYVNDLSSTNWLPLVSNIVLQGTSYLYADTNAVNQPERFYRVTSP